MKSRKYHVFILQGIDHFKATLNLEVQWANEAVIAAVERNGGFITVAYYDTMTLLAAIKPMKFLQRGLYLM